MIVGVLALGLFLAFQGCFGSSSTSWNQRLTLVIETPQGEVLPGRWMFALLKGARAGRVTRG